jgi:ribosome recycling factor
MQELNDIYQDSEHKMQKNIEGLEKELSKIRTDRAHPNLLSDIQVDYYNQRTPLSRIATIIAEDARTLAITPFDKSSLLAIEKAIAAANLGLNPTSVGALIRVPIPQLTEERRKMLVKQAKEDVESAKIAVRNVRRDANSKVKSLLNDKVISLNDKQAAENKIQKITDQYVDKIDKIGTAKSADVMKV